MRYYRSFRFHFDSSVPPEEWSKMLKEIEEAVEQIACDYAAAQGDDSYEVLGPVTVVRETS